jgi:hypothetical protein
LRRRVGEQIDQPGSPPGKRPGQQFLAVVVL